MRNLRHPGPVVGFRRFFLVLAKPVLRISRVMQTGCLTGICDTFRPISGQHGMLLVREPVVKTVEAHHFPGQILV